MRNEGKENSGQKPQNRRGAVEDTGRRGEREDGKEERTQNIKK